MYTKKDLLIKDLRYRIYELEERICPASSHEWKEIGRSFDYSPAANTVYNYQCLKCGKRKTDYIPSSDSLTIDSKDIQIVANSKES